MHDVISGLRKNLITFETVWNIGKVTEGHYMRKSGSPILNLTVRTTHSAQLWISQHDVFSGLQKNLISLETVRDRGRVIVEYYWEFEFILWECYMTNYSQRAPWRRNRNGMAAFLVCTRILLTRKQYEILVSSLGLNNTIRKLGSPFQHPIIDYTQRPLAYI